MNFKFTPKKTAIFIGGIVFAAIFGTIFDSQSSATLIMVGVVFYIANLDKK